MPWYAVLIDGVVASVEREFGVACDRASAARHADVRVIVRRATPEEIARAADQGPSWDDGLDEVIPF
jgi:hypothetical protein